MRIRSFASLSAVAFIFGALLSFSGMVWFSSSADSSSWGIKEHKEHEKRYLLQIEHLTEALNRSEEALIHERKLAVSLQRELNDAHRQINNMSLALQSMHSPNLYTATQDRFLDRQSDQDSAFPADKAFLGTQPSGLTTDFSTANRFSRIDTEISPYEPQTGDTQNMRAFETAAHHSIIPPAAQNEAIQMPYSVVTVLPTRSPISPQKKQFATSTTKTTTRQRKNAARRLPRTSHRKLTQKRRTQPKKRIVKVVKSKVRKVRRPRKVLAQKRPVRFKPTAHVGRVQPRRVSNRIKQRRSKPLKLFNKFARKGVFGAGYAMQ